MRVRNLVEGRWNFEQTRRSKCPPWGLWGGKSGEAGDYLLRLPGEAEFRSMAASHHPVPVKAPEGITFTVDSPTRFSVAGIDKQMVGEVAATIRKLRRPDPYKGKGVRYAGEKVRRKVGKTGK